MKYLTNINLNGNQLERAKFQSVTTLQSVQSPFAGQHVWCTGDNQEYVYDGSKWVNAVSQGDYTFSDGIKESAGRVVGLDFATGVAAGNVTLTADSNGLAASVAEASTSAKGIIEIATDSEAATGTSEVLAVNPKQLKTKVDANDAITGATKTKITYDAKGLVTSGADLEASDIPALDSAKVTTLGSYEKASSAVAIATTDSLNAALGKLEYKADSAVVANTAITGATKTKITYDSKGLVTAGADLAASDIPDISATYVAVTEKGAASGVAELDSNGKVPSSQLPSYVDDVVDLLAIADTAPATCAKGDMYYNTSSKKVFTATATDTWGETGADPEKGKIYVNLANDGCYRWSGSEMINITNPIGAATTSTPGIVELATDAEATTGTDAVLAVTPAALKAAMEDAEIAFTHKTFDANGTGNSLSNVEVADFASGVVVDSTTGIAAVSSASDSKLVSEKAAATSLATKQALVASATNNDIATLDANGQTKDSGKAFVTTLGPATGTGHATDAQIATADAVRAAIDAAAGAAAHKEVEHFDADKATFANGQVTWSFDNPFADADVMVQIKQSDNEVVIADVDTDASTITITFNANAMPDDNAYKAVMIG